MFKNIVRNLAFSPGLVDQVGFYIKRLRQEEFVRRLGMIFTALAVAMQMLSFINPPTYAQTSNDNNVVYEAVTSKDHLLQVWDGSDSHGNEDIDDLFRYYSITRSDVAASTLTTMRSDDQFDGYEIWSIGRIAYSKPSEFAISVPTDEGPNSTFYVRPWARSWGVHETEVLRGITSSGKDFAVILNCGNLVIAIQNPPQPTPVTGDFSVDCQNISGLAYDPRVPAQQLVVVIRIDGTREALVTADQPSTNPDGIIGNHGFSWAIPEEYIDGYRHPVVVIVREDVAARGISEGNQMLTSSSGQNYIPRSCSPKIKVCNITTGEIEIVREAQAEGNSNYVDAKLCQMITVCINDQLVSIHRFKDNGQPRTCPMIQVCRDDAPAWIHTNEQLDSDLPIEQCAEKQVCDIEDGLITIQVKDFDPQRHSVPFTDDFDRLVCEEPSPYFVKSKLVRNLTQSIDNANGTIAQPGDELQYELTTANTGNKDAVYDDFIEPLSDVLEYADLTDNGGGSFNSTTKVLFWNPTEIKAGESITHSFKVTIKNPLPLTAQNLAAPGSFDFIINNVYGNGVEIKLPKPPGKQVESWATTLPNTGPTENGIFLGLFVALVFYFHFRNRLVIKELKLIRSEYNGA